MTQASTTQASTTQAPLRIALISYYLPSGSKIGVGYHVHELAGEFTRRGHHVEVISDCPPVEGASYVHRHVPMTGALRTFRFALAMRRFDFSGYDVLHAAGEDYWLWRRRVPVHVRVLHGSCFDEALHIRGVRARLRMVLLGVTEVIASLVADVTVLVSPVGRRWTPWVRRVIPIGVDTTHFAPGEAAERTGHPVVLFVGTWSGRKRGSLLARAFLDTVLPELPDAELWMVSEDVPTGQHPSIRPLGRVSAQELQSLYRRAWVFCLPSSYEGFGLPYVEAMASGLPAVATTNPGARFVLGDGAGALVTDADLGGALLRLLRDPDEQSRLRAAGLDRAAGLSLAAAADAYERLYRERLVRPA
ncbi:glycosyltransferase family 4 protein [Jatrophihabitans sp.]|uniref:glycosyltransferase family 4 protein n=1 Tax=Jatrophihabitans sp. TaxID=1932789 RepID=UPI0030C745F4|nr:glycosyltransferase family 1 protein [Jatrophihabitans sp.]